MKEREASGPFATETAGFLSGSRGLKQRAGLSICLQCRLFAFRQGQREGRARALDPSV